MPVGDGSGSPLSIHHQRLGRGFDGFFDGTGERLFSHFRANEELLTGTVREADRFPAILSRDRDVDFDCSFRIAYRPDHTGDYGTDGVESDEPVEDRAQTFENAVLDLELPFACAESEGHAYILWIPHNGRFAPVRWRRSYTRYVAHKITLIPGDGIGPEVADATARVVEATGVAVEWERVDAGLAAEKATGHYLPEAVFESLARTHVGLKGLVGNAHW